MTTPTPQASPKVLLIDDNLELLQSTERHLKARGLSVITASSGIGATALVFRHRPEVIVLDVMMPALGGDVLARIIRANSPYEPAIVLYSAMPEDQLYRVAKQTSKTVYVLKSDGVEALFEAIVRTAPLVASP